MFITEDAKKELLKLEKSKFLENEWPNTLKKASSLGIDLSKLINQN
jgi:DNA-binding transcriptional regulator YhcF (GntR family)